MNSSKEKTSTSCKDKFKITTLNVGYVGNTTCLISGRLKKSYTIWLSMLDRCYNAKNQYYYRYGDNGVKVCDEWHCYATFEKWYNENYYEIENEKMQLDKDILIKGNKIYNPNRCIFAPKNINNLFIKSDIKRGTNPIGVYIKNNKYYSQCNAMGKKFSLGYFNTSKEAFQAYKNFKELYIKEVADEYKSKYANFPQKLYDAMYTYEVEITD